MGLSACSDDAAVTAADEGTADGSALDTPSGSGSGEAPCWFESSTDLCPEQPRGVAEEDCPSGALLDGSGFVAGTGLCQPDLPSWDCPEGWEPFQAFTDGSGEEALPPGASQFNRCEPPQPPDDCPPGTLPVPGRAACQPMGTPCPDAAARWPDEVSLRTLAPALTGPIIYVSADAAADGAGTRDNPRPLSAAAVRAAETGIVAMALGDYAATVRLDRRVALLGACVTGTRLAADTSSDSVGVVDIVSAAPVSVANLTLSGDRPGLSVAAGTGESHQLSDLSVEAARTVGITVTGHALHLERMRVTGTRASSTRSFGRALAVLDGAVVTADALAFQGNRDIAISLDGAGASLNATRLLVADTIERLTDGTFGRAIDVRGGATLTLSSALLLSNREVALSAAGTGSVVEANDLLIADTRPRARDSAAGRAVEVDDGATVRLRQVLMRGHREGALVGSGAGTRVELLRVVAQDTLTSLATGDGGYGITISGGASLDAASLLLLRNRSTGLLLSGARTTALVRDAVVASTLAEAAQGGDGIAVESGALADLRRTLVTNNQEAGLFASGTGTRVEFESLAVTATRSNNADGRAGVGLWMQDGATLLGGPLLLASNRFAALYATDASTRVTLSDSLVVDTLPQLRDGRGGMGLFVEQGASVTMQRAAFNHNAEVGLLVSDASTTASLADAVITQTQPRDTGLHGGGAEVQQGASLSLTRVGMQSNTGVSLLVTDEESSATITGLAIEATRTRPSPLGGFGTAVTVQDGASLRGTDLAVAGNPLAGLQLAGTGVTLDLERALFSSNLVGIALQAAGLGSEELRSALREERFEGNGTDISTEAIDIPEPIRDLR